VSNALMRRLTICVGALVVIGFSMWFVNKYFGIEAHAIRMWLWPPPTIEQVEARKLRSLAGWFSLNCGHVRRHEKADAAISCATLALSARKGFYVSFDYVGVDSTGVIGLAGNRSGTVFQVEANQLGRGELAMIATSGPVRTVTVIRCEKSPAEETSFPSNRYLSCN